MKIQKKHAVAVAEMFVFMAQESYYPLCPEEEDLIGRVLGFAVYHKMAEQGELEATKGYGDTKIQKAARLDLTESDMPCIIDMYHEVLGDPKLDEDDLSTMPHAIEYLEKTFEYNPES